MTVSRQVAQAARAFADQQNQAIADIPSGLYIGTVSAVSPLQLSWRNRTVTATGKHAGYSPTVGDRVQFAIHADHQLIVHDKIG